MKKSIHGSISSGYPSCAESASHDNMGRAFCNWQPLPVLSGIGRYEQSCAGCEECVEACPFDCLEMVVREEVRTMLTREQQADLMRLHLKLVPSQLNDLVAELTDAALLAAGITAPSPAMCEEARSAVREVLKKYVTAYDICGLPTYCHEAVEVDP
ncbi:MAG: hypothetical protein NZT92_07525, partial [Abditibacteriales bacterium]|nr:hypothetical protein [Abditibacteriales bacterium]MDW8365801.1 hypothetical protein [Abditibacteriales bacterium]